MKRSLLTPEGMDIKNKKAPSTLLKPNVRPRERSFKRSNATQSILLANLKETVLDFINDIEKLFSDPEDQMEIMKVYLYFSNMSDHDLMNHIIAHILPYSDKIKKRDEAYVLGERSNIFAGFPKSKVEKIVQIVHADPENGGLTREERDAIWEYFDLMIEITDQFKKNV